MTGSTSTEASAKSDGLESLGRQAYRVLRGAIRSGAIQPDRRYSEAELAEVLGVSRTPVREALKALERDGVLRTASRRGYQLRSYSEEEIGELLVLRTLLERLAVSRLAERATPADVERLEAAVARQAEHAAEPTDMFALDEDFHLLIAQLAGLPRTQDILASLRSAMAVIYAGTPPSSGLSREAIAEHRGIVAAIADGAGDRAAQLVERHVEHATQPLLEGARERSAQRALMRLTVS